MQAVHSPQVLHFVPVGYNVRLLEAMLWELHEVVDYFVLYETDATQIGVRKTLMLNASMERWAQFHDKIIYFHDHVPTAEGERILQSVCERNHKGDWTLELQMRSAPVQKFREVMHKYIRSSPDDVLVLGSDADEIATGEAVWHLAHCELKGSPNLNEHVVYFGTVMAKHTLTTLQVHGPGHFFFWLLNHQLPPLNQLLETQSNTGTQSLLPPLPPLTGPTGPKIAPNGRRLMGCWR